MKIGGIEMKTAIVYYSRHHGNTKKLLDAVAAENEIDLIDVIEQPDADLSAYDRIGFASGIYYNAFAAQLMDFVRTKLPEGKDVFYIYTHGAPKGSFLKAIRENRKKLLTRKSAFAIRESYIQLRTNLMYSVASQGESGCRVFGGEVAEALFDRGVCLLSGTDLTPADRRRISSVLPSRS